MIFKHKWPLMQREHSLTQTFSSSIDPARAPGYVSSDANSGEKLVLSGPVGRSWH